MDVLWLLSWPVRFLFGRDVFISYARADGDTYVRKLADQLRRSKPRLSYFLDLYAASADPVVPISALRHARWCRVFVLLASKNAMQPERVTMKELGEFLKRPRRLFIPIDVDGAYDARDRAVPRWLELSGATPEHETAEAVKNGVVSPFVIERIESLVGNARFEPRLTLASAFALLLVATGVLFFFRASIAAGDARANRLAAAATSSMTHDYSMALLLAAESLEIRPELPLPKSAMLDVLMRHGGLITLLHLHSSTPASIEADSKDVSALAFSPDLSLFASGQASGEVRIWNARTRTELCPPIMLRHHVVSLAFDRRNQKLLAGTMEGHLVLCDLPRGGCREKRLTQFADAITAFRPDGGIAAISRRDTLIDPFSNQTPLHVSEDTRAFAFSRDGAYLVTGDLGGALQVFDWKIRQSIDGEMPKLSADESDAGAVESIIASPTDPNLFAASDDSGNIVVFRPHDAKAAHAKVDGEADLAFSPDGRLLAATINHGVAIYSVPALDSVGRFTYADQPVRVAFADRSTLLSGNRDSTIAFFSLDALDPFPDRPARAMESRVSGEIGSMTQAVFAASGDRVGLSDERGQLAVIRLAASSRNDGNVLLPSVRRRGYLELQDAISGKTVRSIELPAKTDAYGAAISGDGRRLAALLDHDKRRTLAIVDVETGEVRKRFALDGGETDTVAIDRNGGRVATGDDAGTVVVRSDNGAQLARFLQDDEISAIAFSPDGRTLVVSDLNATSIYSLDVQLLLGTRSVAADCLAFSPDSKILAVCEPDGLRIWPMTSAAWSDAARRIAGRALTPEERAEYLGGR